MLVTTPLTRLSRFLCKNMLNLPHVARNPFDPINVAAVKQECKYWEQLQETAQRANRSCVKYHTNFRAFVHNDYDDSY